MTKLRDWANTTDLAVYTYDGNGLRVKKQVGTGTPTVYIFSGTSVIAEYAAGAAPSSPQAEYVYSGSQLLATITGGTPKFHIRDHLSTRVTADTNGGNRIEQGHLPFGEQWYQGSGSSKWKFTSYERDSESGNDYAIFRTHINRLGRFNSPDPIAGSLADPQSLNRYAYTRNDPVNLVDPLGLEGVPDMRTGCFIGFWTFVDERGSREWYFVPIFNVSIADCMPGFEDPFAGWGTGSDGAGGTPQRIKDIINAALRQENLAKCLNEFFGPGTILTNENLPYLDATKDLQGAGQTDAKQVPETGRATVQIDRGIYRSLRADDPFLVGTYLHEVANALAIQRFTHVFPGKDRGLRARLGPLGSWPSEEQQRYYDPDIEEQFEKCLYGKD